MSFGGINVFDERSKKERDRRLRRSLLESLYLSRNSPRGGLNGETLMVSVASIISDGLGFEDEDHAMALMRDLVNKQLISEEKLDRRKFERFGPKFVFLRITDKGSMLCREEARPDPDIFDNRAED